MVFLPRGDRVEDVGGASSISLNHKRMCKLRASRVYMAYVSTRFTCSSTLRNLHAFVSLPLTCLFFLFLRTLLAFRFLRAIRAFTFLRILRAFCIFYVRYLSSFFTCLTCLACFHFFTGLHIIYCFHFSYKPSCF